VKEGQVFKMNDSLDGRNGRKIEESIDYILLHFQEPLKVKELAAMADYSPSHFLMFKRKTGCSPINYLIRLRMRRACFLLKTTNLSVKSIARTLGYKDWFYFYRLFKSINEITPTTYRVKVRNIPLSALENLAGDDPFQKLENYRFANTSKTGHFLFVKDVIPDAKILNDTGRKLFDLEQQLDKL
jgi:AraC-like DNA-binding protein